MNNIHSPNGGKLVTEDSKKQYLITSLRRTGIAPMSATYMDNIVRQMGLDVVKVLTPKRTRLETSAAGAVGAGLATQTYVVRMEPERANLIQQTTPVNFHVEEDAFLELGVSSPIFRETPQFGTLLTVSGAEEKTVRFRIVGEGNNPLPDVTVVLTGDGFPQQGKTNQEGEVELKLLTFRGRPARSLYISPQASYWNRYITEPKLTEGEVNIIQLKSFKDLFPGFPDNYKFGWGQRLMGLDLLDERLTGEGVKVAIIDSGADNTHPLLQHIRRGLDLTGNIPTNTWGQDLIGHGSHCAGIITAHSDSQTALRGFVPDAEIHALKVFPGGRFSSLLEALDYCIDQNIDIVNLSLGSPVNSLAVEQKLEEAVLNGIACIVAAGNSGGPVQFPATSQFTLAVSAIGKLREYPEDSWEATTVSAAIPIAPDGVFSPSFTCYGSEIGVCAPGVGIISTVPSNAFEAESGTSMATPHVTGLAALLLAHHPLFKQFKNKDIQRVGILFQMIKSMCLPYNLGTGRTGAGLPRFHGLEQILQPEERLRSSETSMPMGTVSQTTWPTISPTGIPQMLPQVALLDPRVIGGPYIYRMF
jgi:subtilisin family serine protease